MVLRAPAAIDVGHLQEPVRVSSYCTRTVFIVVIVPWEPSADDHRLVHPAPVHLEQQVGEAGSAVPIRDRRLMRPRFPNVCVGVDDHATALSRGAGASALIP